MTNALPDASVREAARDLAHVVDALDDIILGKRQQVQLALTCLLAGGHLLLEDLPGVGKTTLAQALARGLGLAFRRMQFTSDLLPGDVTGSRTFSPDGGHFVFHPGPVFTEVLLADELNRATPRTQGALLEAMEERQVTVDGESHLLPAPFFVIATQNPLQQSGTFPLPESQLDRFLMRLSLGYPAPQHERALLLGDDRRELLARLAPVLPRERLLLLQEEVRRVHVASPLLDYLQSLVGAVRHSQDLEGQLSPRAAMALLRAARARALLAGRAGVIPEDLQAVFLPVVAHRVRAAGTGEDGAAAVVLERLLTRTPVA